ncbi:MAG: hypothetical protein ABEI52_05120, partial [Halobacteriaceae archaeon]
SRSSKTSSIAPIWCLSMVALSTVKYCRSAARAEGSAPFEFQRGVGWQAGDDRTPPPAITLDFASVIRTRKVLKKESW